MPPFGTWGSQVQILPLRPRLSTPRHGKPDSFPDSFERLRFAGTERLCAGGGLGPSPSVELVVEPAGKAGLFSGSVGGESIVRSRQPFLDGARVLLARGY